MEAGKMCIVLEFVTGGSLDDVIQQQKDPLPESLIREYTRQLLLALDYCHTCGVVHRDVKAKNVLVTDGGELKLADFGGAKKSVDLLGKDLLEVTAGLQATLLWMAPELHNSRFNCKADIWSLGCTIIEMATRKKPWDEQNFASFYAAMKFLQEVKTGPPAPQNLSVAGKAFLKRCFTRDYTLRPTAKELLEDNWFRPEEGGKLPFALSPSSTSTAASSNSSSSSATSESPLGPSNSTPVVTPVATPSSPAVGPSTSTSTSVTEVKFNVGAGVLSISQPAPPSGLVEEHEEEMKRNWIFDLAASGPLTALHAPPTTPVVVAPDRMLSTMDFLSMQSVSDANSEAKN